MTEKKADRAKTEDNITMLLLPSVLGICICLVCLFGTTWAWFTASVEVSGQKIASANYAVSVESVKTASEEDGETEVTANENGGYPLSKGTTYTIALRASGTAQECGGYCLIECDDNRFCTETIDPNKEITITFSPTTTGSYTFTGVWGSPPEDAQMLPEPSAEPVKINEENNTRASSEEEENEQEDIPETETEPEPETEIEIESESEPEPEFSEKGQLSDDS